MHTPLNPYDPINNFTDSKISNEQQHALLIVPSVPETLIHGSADFICNNYRIPLISSLPVNDMFDLLAINKAIVVQQEGLSHVIGAAQSRSVGSDHHLRGIIIIKK